MEQRRINNKINKGSVTNINNGVLSQDKYNEFINDLMIERLFESGNGLRSALVEKFGVEDSNARKIISRAVDGKIIISSKPYKFGKGQYIYLLPGQSLSLKAIKNISEKFRPPIYRLLDVMDQHQGIISYYEAMKITSSPDEGSSTKVQTLKDILKILIKLEIVYEKKDENNINYIIYKDETNELEINIEKQLMAIEYGRMVTDCSLIPDILRWMNKSNIIDNIKVIYRNKKSPSFGAKHNTLLWDIFSYTKATGINHVSGINADTIEKQTLVVIDVVLSTSYSDSHLDGFYNRIQININSVKSGERKTLPIIVYRELSEGVLNKINKLGFLAFDIGSIFGSKIYSVLNKINELNSLFRTSANIDKTVIEILNTIRNTGQEDALKDLKGTLFELLMYPLLTLIYPVASIERNKRLNNSDDLVNYFEYDYIINSSNPDELIIVELKGYSSSATIPLGDSKTKSSLSWFFKNTLPYAERYYKGKIEDKSIKAIYITSANFWEDGREFIDKMNTSRYKSKNLNVGYERKDLIKLLEENNLINEIKILEKFYRKSED